MALGVIRGQMILNVKQAVAAYTQARAAHITTVTAMNRGGAVMVRTGAIMAGAGVVMAAGIGVAVKAAADFEKQLDFFGAVSNSTAQEMESVRQKALELGRDTRYSAGQIADSFIELGKAGVSAQDIVEGVGAGVASLGAAADIPLVQSANIIVSAVKTFGLAAEDAVNVADKLAGSANASIVEVEDLGVSLKYAGGVAASLGIPFEDLNTAFALLGKYGIRGSTAGTSMRQMLISLAGNSKKAEVTMKELGIITKDGANKFFDATGKLKPLPKVLDVLRDAVDGLTQEEKIQKLKTMFNVRSLPSVLNLLKDGSDGFNEMSAAIEETKAADVAAARLDNLAGDVEILRGNIETLVIQAGGPLQEMLRGVVQWLTEAVRWFGALSPSTQEAILRFLAISAAVLIFMGTMVIILGTIFRFAAAMIDLYNAVKLIAAGVKIASAAVKAFTISLLTNPVFLIIAAIIALVVAIVLLYKKNKAFREFMDKLGAGIVKAFKAVVAWFKTLPEFFRNLWQDIQDWTTNVWDSVITFFTKTIPDGFKRGLQTVLGFVMSFVVSFINFWIQLPGRVSAYVSALVQRVIAFFQQLPRRLGYLIGFMVGTIIRLWVGLQIRLWSIAAAIVIGVVNWFKALPGRISAFFTRVWEGAKVIWGNIKNFFTKTIPEIYRSIVTWFQRLPGRIRDYFVNMYQNARARLILFALIARVMAKNIYNAVVNWVKQLPGRIRDFFQRTYTNARSKLSNLWTAAKDFARRIYTSISDWVKKIPGVVSDAVSNAIQAFKDMVGRAFSAARDFAGGLWDGFKEGLGINSPSFIEKQMVQITEVTAKETDTLKRQVGAVQRLGNRLTKIPTLQPTTQELATSAAQSLAANVVSEGEKFKKLQESYAELVAKSNASQLAGISLSASTTAASRPLASPDASSPKSSKLKMLEGELELKNGRAYIKGIALEAIDDSDSYDSTLGRMG